jgi:uncharacterized repeat protein (TIGR03803 family)
MSVSKRVHCGASASMAQHPLRRRQALGLIGSLGIGFAGASAWAGQAALQTPPRVLYERLHSFDENTDPSTGGAFPTAGLIQASDGFIYGTCQWSGPNGGGTVYRLVAGEIETVHAFEYLFADGPIGGQEPRGGLLEVSPGVVWGTTRSGGASGDGTVFRLSLADAVHEVICSFSSSTTGRWPTEGVILASDGNFYGSTSVGGASDGGTLFRLRPDGTLENLYSFKKNGSSPVSPAGGLMQASDGFIYGSARGGGAANAGVIYRVSLAGELTIVHEFNRSDGATPETRLVETDDGLFWGTTRQGGIENGGTAFRMTRDGLITTLHRFDKYSETGGYPGGGLLLASDGRFYGATQGSYSRISGAVYRMTRKGKVTALYNFGAGILPQSNLLEQPGGVLLGTEPNGGDFIRGTLYRLSDSGFAGAA